VLTTALVGIVTVPPVSAHRPPERRRHGVEEHNEPRAPGVPGPVRGSGVPVERGTRC
jgi:hypothetical protein